MTHTSEQLAVGSPLSEEATQGLGSRDITRRSFLLTVGALGLAASTVLSGCAGSDDEVASEAEDISTEVDNATPTDIRSRILGVDAEIELGDGTLAPLINFDNAATTPAFLEVAAEIEAQLAYYGSIGRGWGQKSAHSTEIYEAGRMAVMDFVNADQDKNTVFYVNNTTDGLNKLSSALIESKEDIVLTTRMEHHANDLNWRLRGTTIYAEVDELGRLKLDEVERLLKENDVKIVSVTAASNVTGYVNDVHAIAKLAHANGALIVVDGAQIVAHREFSMTG
ncbi:MAG: aminotransferase class V-fold PLP-dependent enzyme, partial [Actinomycetia bacterium]|nr:aminotransferase class V-fold PLP-dependent enzyme [Actinomycetes bacterium]